jgi:hypothetical protein
MVGGCGETQPESDDVALEDRFARQYARHSCEWLARGQVELHHELVAVRGGRGANHDGEVVVPALDVDVEGDLNSGVSRCEKEKSWLASPIGHASH